MLNIFLCACWPSICLSMFHLKDACMYIQVGNNVFYFFFAFKKLLRKMLFKKKKEKEKNYTQSLQLKK